jgi:hypothetical protein
VLERWLRPGRTSTRDVLLDMTALVALAVLLMGAGLGLRDPWPADEPRFALIAQDMLRSGDWLIPRVGGDLYADKPPFYFWLMASAMALTGSLRLGFLLPSLLAGVGTVLLVYDLLRRARGREVALAGAFAPGFDRVTVGRLAPFIAAGHGHHPLQRAGFAAIAGDDGNGAGRIVAALQHRAKAASGVYPAQQRRYRHAAGDSCHLRPRGAAPRLAAASR